MCLRYEDAHSEGGSRVEGNRAFDTDKECITILPTPEEIRHIEINILDENEDTVFECSGTVTRKTAHKFMEFVGAAYVPQEPLRALRPPVAVRAIGKISCEHDRDCTVYPNKCPKCGNNKAKSYFKPKEKEG